MQAQNRCQARVFYQDIVFIEFVSGPQVEVRFGCRVLWQLWQNVAVKVAGAHLDDAPAPRPQKALTDRISHVPYEALEDDLKRVREGPDCGGASLGDADRASGMRMGATQWLPRRTRSC